MHQNKEKESRDETQSCNRRECPLFDPRRYLHKLRELLPYVPPVNLGELERLHRAHDYRGIVQLVKRLMTIEAITFKVFWVPDGVVHEGSLKDAPAWVQMPSEMPFYGSKEFKQMTIELFFRKSFFQQSYDRATSPRSAGTHHTCPLGISPTVGMVANSPELLSRLANAIR